MGSRDRERVPAIVRFVFGESTSRASHSPNTCARSTLVVQACDSEEYVLVYPTATLSDCNIAAVKPGFALSGSYLPTPLPVPGQVFVSGTRGNSGFAAKLGDISLGGCFVQTESPLETGRTLTLLLKVGNIEIRAAGVVRIHYEGMAMGVEFTHMSPADQGSLNKLVVQLQAAEAPPSLLGSLTMLPLNESV